MNRRILPARRPARSPLLLASFLVVTGVLASGAVADASARTPAATPPRAAVSAVAAGDPLDAFRDPRLDAAEVHALRHERRREHVRLPSPRRAQQKAALPEWTVGDFLHFDVSLTLDPQTGFVTTRTLIPVRARGDVSTAVFTVAPLAVEGVTVSLPKAGDDPPAGGRAVSATYDDNSWQLRVEFEPGLAAGEEVTLEVMMSGKFDCDGLGGGIPMCGFSPSLSFATGLPFFPTPIGEAELFTADLHVTVPDGYVVAANGELEEVLSEEGYTTYSFLRPYPGRYVVFSVAEYVRTDGVAGEVPLSAFTFASDARYASFVLDEAADVIDFYAGNFAPFPYAKQDIVEMANDFGGGFGPLQAIFMTGHVFRASPDSWQWSTLVQLQSHELAHQWWGNFVGIGDNDSVVISEGMAEFSSAWHYELRKGSRSNFVTNGYSYMFGVPSAYDVPASSGGVYYSDYYVPIVYDKGSMVMDMLRWELGEDAFATLLTQIFDRRGGGFLTVRELEALASEIAGEEMGWFFDQWYFGTGYPRIVMHVRQEQVSGDSWRIHVRFSQPETPTFQVTLPVYWRTSDGVLHEEDVWLDGDVVEHVIESPMPAVTVAPDPYHRLLQVTTSSSAADVNVTGDVDAFDLLDLSVRYGTGIIREWNGHEYLMPDARYEVRYDVDRNGRIERADRDAVVAEHTWYTGTLPDTAPPADPAE